MVVVGVCIFCFVLHYAPLIDAAGVGNEARVRARALAAACCCGEQRSHPQRCSSVHFSDLSGCKFSSQLNFKSVHTSV